VLALLVAAAMALSLFDTASRPHAARRPTASPPAGVGPTDSPEVEALPGALGGLVLRGVPLRPGMTVAKVDEGAASGPWAVVVRRLDGSLGRHGAVVTYPVGLSDMARADTVVPLGRTVGWAANGLVSWPLGRGQARVRGDLSVPELSAIAAGTAVASARPVVSAPRGFRVDSIGPLRPQLVHEVRYDAGQAGAAALSGLVYTGVTAGAGFEDALFAGAATPAGTVRGQPAMLSSVMGGNATLAWELSPGVVGYVGYSGDATPGRAADALRGLAERTRLLSVYDWLATTPMLSEGTNQP
jgi:hypothetical protein